MVQHCNIDRRFGIRNTNKLSMDIEYPKLESYEEKLAGIETELEDARSDVKIRTETFISNCQVTFDSVLGYLSSDTLPPVIE